jgi:hypothetical protein
MPIMPLVRSDREKNHDMTFWKGKQDILRHSYGTHRIAIVRNAHQVAEEMGNSVQIVRRHYDATAEYFTNTGSRVIERIKETTPIYQAQTFFRGGQFEHPVSYVCADRLESSKR